MEMFFIVQSLGEKIMVLVQQQRDLKKINHLRDRLSGTVQQQRPEQSKQH
jgi:hypothetical protein